MIFDMVYTETSCYAMPEVEITKHDASHRYEALRGHGYVLGVFKDNDCIGWIDVTKLGYDSVNDWLKQGGFKYVL